MQPGHSAHLPDLQALSGVEAVGGRLSLSGIATLRGLGTLTVQDTVEISRVRQDRDLRHLSGVQLHNGLSLVSNPALTTLEGLQVPAGGTCGAWTSCARQDGWSCRGCPG